MYMCVHVSFPKNIFSAVVKWTLCALLTCDDGGPFTYGVSWNYIIQIMSSSKNDKLGNINMCMLVFQLRLVFL